MAKTKILLDMDGVIANFYKEFALFLNEKHNCTLLPDKEPLRYSFNNWGHGIKHVDINTASNNWILNNGMRNIPSFPGTKKFAHSLFKQYDVTIVTARIGDWERQFSLRIKDQIMLDTRKWLQKLNIPIKKLYFSHEKVDFCLKNNINIMIEDKLSTAISAAKNNIDTVLINRRYNKGPNKSRIHRVDSFNDVLNKIKELCL